LLDGCAAQAPPHPPRLQRPEAVTDAKVRQVGLDLDLSFTVPTLAIDGESLTKPLEIQMLRSVEGPAPASAAHTEASSATSAGASPVAAPLATLSAQDLARLTVDGRVLYRDALTPPTFASLVGSRISFQVRGLTRGFRGRPIVADPSNTAALTLLDVPQAPAALTAEPSQAALRLHWSAPAKTVTGHSAGFITEYRVYRSTSEKAPGFQFLGVAHQTSYDDAKFEFGHFYAYDVRALVSEGGQTAESASSEAVSIVPRDTFAPAAPADLTAVFSFGAVELIWSPNAEPDLAGYNVYRSEAGAAAAKLNSEPLRSPLYRDAAVTAGRRYVYTVTAVDNSGNESNHSGEAAVEIP
jgi:hypothetical protein